MERDLKEKLERNIWITRKCRINASERLLKSAKFVEFLNVYYSIFVITLSLLSLIQHNDQFSFASIVLSIALTISIVYANTTGLRDRSTVLKQNYIDLQVLLDQLFYIEATETEKVLTVSDKYAELLKLSENHLSIDLYRVKSTSSDTNFKMDRVGKVYPTRFVGLSMETLLGCCASYWDNLSLLCGVMIDVCCSVFL